MDNFIISIEKFMIMVNGGRGFLDARGSRASGSMDGRVKETRPAAEETVEESYYKLWMEVVGDPLAIYRQEWRRTDQTWRTMGISGS